MTPAQHLASLRVVRDVIAERHRQHAKWGEQDLSWDVHPSDREMLYALLMNSRAQQEGGASSYAYVLIEEVCEALLCEGAPLERQWRRAELVQVAAVAVQAIEAGDREAA